MRSLWAVLVVGCLLAWAAPAGAAVTVAYNATTDALTVTDSAGAANSVALNCTSGTVRVLVNAVPTGPTPSCAEVASLTISMGDGNDTVDTSALPASVGPVSQISVDLGAGSDTFVGGPENEAVGGGDGGDTIFASRGYDDLDGEGPAWEIDRLRFVNQGNVKLLPEVFEIGVGATTFETNYNNFVVVDIEDNRSSPAADANNRIDVAAVETHDALGPGTVNISAGPGDDHVLPSETGSVSGGTGLDRVSFVAEQAAGVTYKIANTRLDQAGGANDGEVWLWDATFEQVAVLGASDSADTLDATTTTAAVSVFLDGRSGADTLRAGGAPAQLTGGEGADTITTGEAVATVTGDAGEDVIDLGPGGGTVDGGTENDDVSYGPGADSVDGGPGSDRADVDIATIASRALTASAVGADPIAAVEELTVRGTAGSDHLDATAYTASLVLLGGDGDDVLLGGSGADRCEGGAGTDTCDLRGGDDSADGGDADDTVLGGAGADSLGGGNGNDKLDGGDGNDRLDGGEGADALAGGANDDDLYGGGGDDTLDGGPGADRLVGGPGRDFVAYHGPRPAVIDLSGARTSGPAGEGDVLAEIETAEGGDGADQLFGSPAGETLRGRGGNDVIDGGAGPDVQEGGPGNDALEAGPGGGGDGDVLSGGDGVDSVSYGDHGQTGVTVDVDAQADDGTPGEGDLVGEENEIVVGSAGADRLTASVRLPTAGVPPRLSILAGMGGNDTLQGGPDGDALGGGTGNDTIDAGGGNDAVQGGSGNDDLDGGAGNDRLLGQKGIDTISGDDGSDMVFSLDLSKDRVTCGDGEDQVYQGAGDRVSGATCEDSDGRGDNAKPTAPGGQEDGTDQTLKEGDGLFGDGGDSGPDKDDDGQSAYTNPEDFAFDLAEGLEGFDDFGFDFGEGFGDDAFGLEGFDDFGDFVGDDLGGKEPPAATVRTKAATAAAGRAPVQVSCPRKLEKRCIGELVVTQPGKTRELGSSLFTVKAGKRVSSRIKLNATGRRLLSRARRGRLKVDVTLNGRDRGTGLFQSTKSLTLRKGKAPARRRSRR